MGRKIMTEECLIKKLKKVHRDEYIYDNIGYIGCKKDITIICKKHGAFKINADRHLRGQKCSLCNKENRSYINKCRTEDKFKRETSETRIPI